MGISKQNRPKHRELIRWDSEYPHASRNRIRKLICGAADDKDLQILMSIIKHCQASSIKLPWDSIGKDIGPTVTGNAVVQHLAKLKKKVEENQGVAAAAGVTAGRASRASVTRTSKTSAAKAIEKDAIDSDYDVDNASDSEESFGESSKKKKAPKKESTIKVETPSKGVKRAKPQESSEPEETPIKRRTRSSDAAKARSEVVEDSDDERSGKQYVAAGSQFLAFDHSDTDEQSLAGNVDGAEDESMGNIESVEGEGKAKSKIVTLSFQNKYLLQRLGGSYPFAAIKSKSVPGTPSADGSGVPLRGHGGHGQSFGQQPGYNMNYHGYVPSTPPNQRSFDASAFGQYSGFPPQGFAPMVAHSHPGFGPSNGGHWNEQLSPLQQHRRSVDLGLSGAYGQRGEFMTGGGYHDHLSYPGPTPYHNSAYHLNAHQSALAAGDSEAKAMNHRFEGDSAEQKENEGEDLLSQFANSNFDEMLNQDLGSG